MCRESRHTQTCTDAASKNEQPGLMVLARCEGVGEAGTFCWWQNLRRGKTAGNQNLRQGYRRRACRTGRRRLRTVHREKRRFPSALESQTGGRSQTSGSDCSLLGQDIHHTERGDDERVGWRAPRLAFHDALRPPLQVRMTYKTRRSSRRHRSRLPTVEAPESRSIA